MAEFERIAVVERGMSATRLLNAVAEYNDEHGTRLSTVALYTDPDARALPVRRADDAVSIGAPTYLSPRDGRRRPAYLDFDRLSDALVRARADAVWGGWGTTRDIADLAARCADLGIAYVGPTLETLRAVEDAVALRRLAGGAAVACLPWSGEAIPDLAEALRHADMLGYPVRVVAVSSGDDVRVAWDRDELIDAFESARTELEERTGDGAVILERHVERARLLDVSVAADGTGTVWVLGVGDTSVRVANRRVLTESHAPGISAATRKRAGAAAERLARACGLRGTAVFRFQHSADHEVATYGCDVRLGHSPSVTELVSGVDVAKLQLDFARGAKLDPVPPPLRGHAMAVRVRARDPERGFAPTPGTLRALELPSGAGVRTDSGLAEHDRVVADFDPVLAEVAVWGRDRAEALARLRRALEQATLLVEGGTTDKSYLLSVVRRTEVADGTVHRQWLDGLSGGEALLPPPEPLALLYAAVAAYEADHEVRKAQFLATAARGRPEVQLPAGQRVQLRYAGATFRLRVLRRGADRYRVALGEQVAELRVEALGAHERRVSALGRRHRVVLALEGPNLHVEVDGVLHRLVRDDGSTVAAPVPSMVVSVTVAAGDLVAAGDVLAVLESMKMETTVRARFAGRVRTVAVRPGTQVAAGTPLVLLESVEQAPEAQSEVELGLPPTPGTADAAGPLSRCVSLLDELRALLLGYDLDRAEVRHDLEAQRTVCAALPADHPVLLEQEHEILAAFADISALSRRQPEPDIGLDEHARSAEEHLFTYLRSLDPERAGLPAWFVRHLRRALARYGVERLERSPALEEALVWMFRAFTRVEQVVPAIVGILERRLGDVELLREEAGEPFRRLLTDLLAAAEGRYPAIADMVREVRYRYYEQPALEASRAAIYARTEEHLEALAAQPDAADRVERIRAVVDTPLPMRGRLIEWYQRSGPQLQEAILEIRMRRYYRARDLQHVETTRVDGQLFATAEYERDSRTVFLALCYAPFDEVVAIVERLGRLLDAVPEDRLVVLDAYTLRAGPGDPAGADALGEEIKGVLDGVRLPRLLHRLDLTVTDSANLARRARTLHFTFRQHDQGFEEERLYRNLHPMLGKRLELWRLARFSVERLASAEDVFLFHGVARDNPADERLFALAEVHDLTPVEGENGRPTHPHLERTLTEAFSAIRRYQTARPAHQRLLWNRVELYVRPPWTLPPATWRELAHQLAPASRDLGLEKVVIRVRIPSRDGELADSVLHVENPGSQGVTVRMEVPDDAPIAPLNPYQQKVLKTQRRGSVYPYELVRMLTPQRGTAADFPPGSFTEYDLDDDGRLTPVVRDPGLNSANLVVGVMTSVTAKHPEGMRRVALLGDPSRSLGSLAEAECRRINAAIDLAQELGVPVEWFALSSGARISMDSGTENMDWIGAVLRRIIEFTQAGGEINVVVTGINVGAQPYWNAEATMLMHTRGILVMTPQSAMVLTGKTALDFAGGVSAEDNYGIGGYERIMGPNGQAQYWAPDLAAACQLLYRYYDHTYVVPGERFPRRAVTEDPIDRDVRDFPHARLPDSDFTTVGDVFSRDRNPDRKKPFDIRSVLRAVSDQDHEPLERWERMIDAETAVVWDAHVGGFPVCLLGLESHAVPRRSLAPAYGPSLWTSGTLFPRSSKKVARALNAASGNRPVVVLANLSGFDGSPESMREWQLEFGAEIGRAVTNFDGPIVFAVVSRYHGGAFVVFAKTLNAGLEIAAVEGSFASVIGGGAAAAVVFPREVDTRTKRDARVAEASAALAGADPATTPVLSRRLAEVTERVRAEKLRQVAEEFNNIHSIQRARDVGSVDRIIQAAGLRPYVVDALERGMARSTDSAPEAVRP